MRLQKGGSRSSSQGRILFEMEGVDADTVAKQAMRLAAAKLPIHTRVRYTIRLKAEAS